MYVCNCNGVRETEVKTAILLGKQSWEEVLSHYGYEPCCGKCEAEIEQMIETLER